MGKRGGRGGSGKGDGGEYTDQYGGFGSQDRDGSFQPSKTGGQSGGGTAGKSKHGSVQLSYQRHVPKFLQPYSHMLGAGKGQQAQSEDEPVVLDEEQQKKRQKRGPADSDDDGDDDAEAIQRALEENPHLAEELGLDNKYVKKIQAKQEKEKGNKAFAAKKYEEAISHFSKCIELDPSDEVYFSNRSAAHAGAGNWDEARADAEAVLKLKPNWVKGHARLAAALYGLQQYGEAREAYDRALALEPDDQALQRSRDKAIGMELQHMRDNKHVFKKSRAPGVAQSGSTAQSSKAAPGKAAPGKMGPASAGIKDKGLLSFAGDEDEEG